MDNLIPQANTARPNTPDEAREASPCSASPLPGEVVLRYVAPGPAEVVLRYAPAAPAKDAAQERIPENGAPAYDYDESYEDELRPHKGLTIFLICLAPLLVALLTLGILYSRGVLPLRRAVGAADNPASVPEAEAPLGDEPTIARYPNGGNVRLRYSVEHGEALTIQNIYELVNPCTVTVATELPGGKAIIGTGVIFTEDGYILTNAHVIEGGTRCYVVLDDGTSFTDVRLVGCDMEKDLAVIKVDAYLLPTVEFGDSDALTVGDPVYAIGNPLGVQLRGTLTDGIVSAINRDVVVDGIKMTLIQTNAALNNGNSGGPLINAYGQVVGINTMKMGSSARPNVEGLGFAIPISTAAWMVNDLIATGKIGGEPVLGVTVLSQPFTLAGGETALQIYEVTPGGSGDMAGLREGDFILSAAGEPVSTLSDLLCIRRRFCRDEALPMVIERDGERLLVDVVLDALPLAD